MDMVLPKKFPYKFLILIFLITILSIALISETNTAVSSLNKTLPAGNTSEGFVPGNKVHKSKGAELLTKGISISREREKDGCSTSGNYIDPCTRLFKLKEVIHNAKR